MELVVLLLIMALIPATIAKKKGRSFALWYLYGIALWIFALIHSLCMKDESGVKCPQCKEWIKEEASVCKHCHTVLADYYRNANKEVNN